MSTYKFAARKSTAVIGNKVIKFDSQNEAQLADWFEANGFAGLWERNVGAVNGGSRYTCDFELSVLDNGRTKRAIVEAKPYKAALTPSIIRRMQGVAVNYKTDLLLLYARREDSWYRIDPTKSGTGSITPTAPPIPGQVPLSKLPKALSITFEKKGGKLYGRRLNPGGWLADLVIGLLQGPKPNHRLGKRY